MSVTRLVSVDNLLLNFLVTVNHVTELSGRWQKLNHKEPPGAELTWL